jgi:hypothetical protein
MRCKTFVLLLTSALLLSLPAAAQDVIDIPVDIGQSAKEIRVPHHNADGKLTLRLNAARAERSSTSEFTFNDLRIEIFDEDTERAALEVILQGAVFDRTTNQLSSDSRSVIRGENIEITGRRLDFNIDDRVSRLQGPVTMIVTSPVQASP